jgi:hypothetical protein
MSPGRDQDYFAEGIAEELRWCGVSRARPLFPPDSTGEIVFLQILPFDERWK